MSEKETAPSSRIVRISIAFVIFAAAGLLAGCSQAKGRVLSVEADNDVRLVNGEMDYGITITVTIKNVGASDSIKITPRLSSSEGEWQRTQSLHFDAGETKKLTYFFDEPTINATNLHYGVAVFPKASQ